MKLRSLVQDALYLNWALPADALPSPPAPLQYQVYGEGDEERVFASALLFRHRGVHLPHLPVVRFTYPQMNLRLYAVDGDGVPCVLFREMLMPWWVGPVVRWVTKQPASAARFSYPRPSRDPGAESWSWRVTQGGRFEVTARRGAPGTGEGPSLGSWAKTVRFFRERSRGYLLSGDRLRRIETEHPSVPVWPLVAEVEDAELLERSLPLAGAAWPRLHSAWLCPRIPFVFDLRIVPEVEMEATLPRAAASTRSAAASAIFRRP
jgi:hypothetical protein